ncbi:MAG: hydrogenase formation protein HypD [Planctomycetota bacterium]
MTSLAQPVARQPVIEHMHTVAGQIGRHVQFMEVCGTHTMSAFRCGLHGLLPKNVTLLSGPGCPVCVTAQGDIDLMIDLAQRPGVTMCTYGDMMRVPGSRGSLEAARSAGADVRVIYSALDAVRIAEENGDHHPVVLAAIGFETTAPTAAAAVLRAHQQGLDNFSLLACLKLVVPAMTSVLTLRGRSRRGVEGFLCPGHVSAIIGSEAFRPVADEYGVPCVVGGFEPTLMSQAVVALLEQVRDGRHDLENLYPEVVTPAGNRIAQRWIDEVFEPVVTRWRGLGTIPESGLAIRKAYSGYDARRVFELHPVVAPEPDGCRCGEVIAGLVRPDQCRLFGERCNPTRPIGPCMVSGEGTCQAWFKYGRANAPKPSCQSVTPPETDGP